MRLSRDFFYTLREDVKDEDSVSGNLLVKSGMIKKISNGIYMNMPLGERISKKVIEIVREEMNNVGASEVTMPHMLPLDFFETSGGADNFDSSMFRFQDRYGRPYVLGLTHEELFVCAAQSKVKSYRDLPFIIYQIGEMYRDEPKPRHGLICAKEFIMKDAYSFDVSEESMQESYKKMLEAYHNIFTRIGLEYNVVKADTGVIGGVLSEEFQAITDAGEDILVLCDSCDYSSNIKVSECVANNKMEDGIERDYSEVYTPNAGSIEEVTEFLKLPADKFIKTMIYRIDDKFYACMVEADREVNETKVRKLVSGNEIELASEEDVSRITNARVGFAGPVGIDVPIIMDENIMMKKNFIVGANKSDYHFKDVNLKDFNPSIIADIKKNKEGDICPKCGGRIYFKNGIEIGNVVKLGTKYSEKLGLNYLDNENKLHSVQMGWYGIGISRIIASVIEQNHDEKGIIWPMSIAPFKVAIVVIDAKNEEQINLAEKLYFEFNNIGIDAILDDRNERAGVKFNDMELIGIPIRVTIGKKINEGLVELKARTSECSDLIKIDELVNEVRKMV